MFFFFTIKTVKMSPVKNPDDCLLRLSALVDELVSADNGYFQGWTQLLL